MAKMDTLCIELISLHEAIMRTEINFKKLAIDKRNETTVRGRLDLLNEKWKRCLELDLQARALYTKEEKQSIEYFTESQFLQIEEAYLAALDYLNSKLHTIVSNVTATANPTRENSTRQYSNFLRLPKITQPEFSGNYVDFENFRDMFEALVVNNDLLSNVSRLHYLKTSLTSDASHVIKHVTVTEASFVTAWDMIKKRYDNKRALINAHLQAIASIPNVSNNSVAELRVLRDTTNEALTCLKNLNRSTQHWDDVMVFCIVRKLDLQSLKEWESHLGSETDYPSFQKLDNFLATRVLTLEAIQLSKSNLSDKDKNNKGQSVKGHNASTNSKCLMCKESHHLFKCKQFRELSIDQRKELALRNHCCLNCLTRGHKPYNCSSKYTCGKCHRKHNTLLHIEFKSNSNSSATPPALSSANTLAITSQVAGTSNSGVIIKEISDNPSLSIKGSHHTNLNDTTVYFLNNTRDLSRSTLLATAVVNVRADNGRVHSFRVLLDQGSECCFVSEKMVKILNPKYQRVNALVYGVGGEMIGAAKKLAQVSLLPKMGMLEPVLMQALVLLHLTSYTPPARPGGGVEMEINKNLLADPDPFSSGAIDIILGADMFGSCLLSGLKQGALGSLTAQDTIFGWILSGPVLKWTTGCSLPITAHQSITEEVLHDDLLRFWEMEEPASRSYLTADEMSCEEHFVSTHQRLESGRYMVRLPFKNGPPIDIGNSLNRAKLVLKRVHTRLLKDPALYSEYADFLSEYEQLGYMSRVQEFTEADTPQTIYLPHHPIVKDDSSTTRLRVVFNASSLTSNNTSLNSHLHIGPKILTDLKVEAWELDTVTYATASAPYIANRVIKQLAADEDSNFPAAKSVLENNVYVDDVLFGADEIEEAQQLRTQVIHLFEKGCFHLRKWKNNNELLLLDCPSGTHERAFDFLMDEEIKLKVLGLQWNPVYDVFQFKVESKTMNSPTKRLVLSVIAKLYDPMGWLSPVVIVAKRLMQQLWLQKLQWDESLPKDLEEHWSKYHMGLSQLQAIQIPRWTGQSADSLGCELHGFSDASSRAYAAVVYLRIIQEDGTAKVTLLTAKSRVAPILPMTIPRLELCGAQLLAKTLHFLIPLGLLSILRIGVLSCQIELVPNAKWRHVSTKDNPADCASRGLFPEELKDHPLWWHGPQWLAKHSASCPKSPPILSPDVDLEWSKIATHYAMKQPDQSFDLANRLSSWPKLLRVTAYGTRFCTAFLIKVGRLPKSTIQHDTLTLSPDEIQQASFYWVRRIQKEAFELELLALQRNDKIKLSSSLKTLHPFLDASGILRLGGRLDNAPINYDEKHPIILPRHRISELIVCHAHTRSLHGGTQLTLRTLRQRFWVLGARALVKKLIHACVPCIRQRATLSQQLMGSLPNFRTTPSRPFTHTGVDYMGPFNVRGSPGRGQKSYKGYVALFVCCVTRAIHLELVSDYSSEAFLAAYHCFSNRRGLPAHMYSDNGTTFQGADRELRNCVLKLRKDFDLQNQLATQGTAWRFIPPSAPHFGGIWEAGVKSFKHHFRRIVGSRTLTFEEFYTTLTRIEAAINSCPIGPLSDDSNDLTYLTPGHFLIGAPLSSPPEQSVEFVAENRLSRWNIIQHITEIFWRRWTVEYLHFLQRRYKWSREQTNLKVGDLVLIRNDGLPPTKWSLGRVIKCYPGKDGLVRSVRIKTATSEFDRPIVKLCLLPLSSETSAELLENYS